MRIRLARRSAAAKAKARMKNSGSLRFLGSNTAVYLSATVVQSAIGFFMIPLYAHNLTKQEFGAMDQVMQFVTIAQMLASLGLPLGMVRGFYLESRSEETRRRMAGALFHLLFPLTVVVSVGIFLFARPLADLVFAGKGKVEWMQLCGVLLMISSLYTFPISLLRTLQVSVTVARWGAITTIINAFFSLVLLVTHHFSLTTLMLAYCGAYAISATALLPRFFNFSIINRHFSLLRPLFAFGLPQLPNAASRKCLEVAGRYMLPHYFGLAELGTFAMGLKIAMILDVMILSPFASAWTPFFYAQAENPKAPELFARITGLTVTALCLIMLTLEAVKPLILSFLGGGRFSDSGPVVSALLLGFFFNGLQYTVAPGIHLTKKLVSEALLMAVSAVVCIALNSVLIPKFQATGAALAQTGGYGFYLCSTFFLSQRVYPVAYPWKKIAGTVAAAAVCWWALNGAHNIIIRALIAIGFAGFCLMVDPALPVMAGKMAGQLWGKIVTKKSVLSRGPDSTISEAKKQ